MSRYNKNKQIKYKEKVNKYNKQILIIYLINLHIKQHYKILNYKKKHKQVLPLNS